MGLSIWWKKPARTKAATLVSVPSRGNGVIDDVAAVDDAHDDAMFPSPLGEMGLSIVLTILAQRDNSRVHSIYQYLTHAFSILK